MEKNKVIKMVVPEACPHCQKEIYVCYIMMVPNITSVITNEEIEKSKEEVKKKLEFIEFKKPKEKEGIVKWLSDETTLISQSDVEEILKQIMSDQKNENENENDKEKDNEGKKEPKAF